MGKTWDVILGTVDGGVYKISAQWTGPRHEAGALHREVAVLCTRRYGKPSPGALLLWDASDGNMVLDVANIGSEGIVNFFVTSRMVRSFKRTYPA